MTKAQEIQEHANNNIRVFYEALKSVFGPIRRSYCHVKDSTGTFFIKERDGIISRWAEHFNSSPYGAPGLRERNLAKQK